MRASFFGVNEDLILLDILISYSICSVIYHRKALLENSLHCEVTEL